MDGSPIVSVTSACHSFGGVVVLDCVNLDVKPGEIYGLLGPNGAGKSTLMRSMCGQLRLDRGHVLVAGRDPANDATARRSIALVPQDIALFPHLTVRENLAVFGRLAGLRRSSLQDAIDSCMALAGLGDRASQICGTLSGGYQRRVNICASILRRPAALVLDEPTVGIDIDAREAIHGMLAELRGRGTAIVLTTHDIEQAELLADRVGVLVAGRLVAEGVPTALVQDMFGQTSEILATLSACPGTDVVEALQAGGFTATQNPVVWSMRTASSPIEAGAVEAWFARAGARVRELRIRKPDLRSVFLELTTRHGVA
jgi:ABC-2 type transport system ATP-binding protein